MARPAVLAIVALTGLSLTACAGMFGQPGFSLPVAGDEVQTVSDVADSLDAHRSSATENARAAIGVANALGSVIREVSRDERALSAPRHARNNAASLGVVSRSQLVMRPRLGNVFAYCESSAGYAIKGIPSLDETFGWQSGAYAGGTRVIDGHGFSTWSANASGKSVQAPIGGLSVVRNGGGTSCPMMAPTYSVSGSTGGDAFSIPITLSYRRGMLWNLSVSNAMFSGGEILDVATSSDRQASFMGFIAKDGTQLAELRADGFGNGTLTITSTGAQYRLADWIVTGT
ncbi:MAG: hypothetical protein WAK16_11315 [Candidatus Cybelea sp.]|jgi:hypothetical protein